MLTVPSQFYIDHLTFFKHCISHSCDNATAVTYTHGTQDDYLTKTKIKKNLRQNINANHRDLQIKKYKTYVHLAILQGTHGVVSD